jgi:hypothetical protein
VEIDRLLSLELACEYLVGFKDIIEYLARQFDGSNLNAPVTSLRRQTMRISSTTEKCCNFRIERSKRFSGKIERF